jgi:integrase
VADKRGDKPHLRKRSARGYELTYRSATGARATQTIHARTRTEARRLADDFLQQQERIRLGLENAIQLVTVEEAFRRYREVASAKKSWPMEWGRWKNHILELDAEGRARSRLGKKLFHQVTPADIEALLLAKLKEGQAPRSVRQLKMHLGKLYSWGIRKARLLRGENPGWLAEMPCDIPPVTPKAMSEAQLERLLTRGFDTFDTFFLLIFDTYTGLRRGELCGLTWPNLHETFAWVERSFGDITKGKRARNVPIHPVLRPYVQMARALARSEYVFPGRDGGMRPTWWNGTEVFRTCLKRAGLIKGWVQECRPRRGARTGRDNPKSKLSAEQVADLRRRVKAGEGAADVAKAFGITHQAVRHHVRSEGKPRPPGGCGYVSGLLPEEATGPCPTCGAPLLARAVPLDFTLKDLRSSFGSYVAESTGGLRAAQLLLGHQDHNTTDQHYAHRRNAFLEAQLAEVRIVDAAKLPSVGLLSENGANNLPTASADSLPLPAVTADGCPQERHELQSLAAKGG